MPFVGLASIIIIIFLIVKFRHTIRGKSKINTFYTEMEISKDREEKSKKVSRFLELCYIEGLRRGGKRICPVCGNCYSVDETVTDENGDESSKFTDKKCPRCSVKFFKTAGNSYRGRFEIERDVEIKKKYKDNYEKLKKYIDTYGSEALETDFSDSIFDSLR